ncbi:LAFA_0A02212g1_1 [Lachancea sp. 'fantastica']|nr:LAFA_0A02212g1_1 [Lachancea sp. 'fantastica']
MRRSANAEDSVGGTRNADQDNATLSKKLKIGQEDLSLFKPGSIVRLHLENFVTYALGDFFLSPALNMVIGPNGSGKSSFVCGVCLGLAGKPEYIGRSKRVDDFIKNGENTSTIETTLMLGPEECFQEFANENHTAKITRIIERNVKKSRYLINGKEVNETNVKWLVSKLNIQLDNLCQFLSQERVQDFSKLKSDKLLVETIRSVDVSMLNNLEDLKALQTEELNCAKELQIKEIRQSELSANREKLESSVRTLEIFRQKKRDLAIHEKLLPYAKVKDHKLRIQDHKNVCETSKRQLKSLLSDKKPFGNALDRVKNECKHKLNKKLKLEEKFRKKKEAYNQYVERLNNYQNEIALKKNDIEHYKGRTDKIRKDIKRKTQELHEKEELLASLSEPDETEVNNLFDQRKALQQSIADFRDKIRDLESANESLQYKLASQRDSLASKAQGLKSDDKINVLEGRGDGLKDIRGAVQYIRSQPKMSGLVLEPPIMLVSSKQPELAKYIWTCVGFANSVALTMVDANAYDRFNDEILYNFGVNLRQLTGQQLRSPHSLAELRSMGFEGYISDLLTGDARVSEMMCQVSGLHLIPFTRKHLSAEQQEFLAAPNAKGDVKFRKVIAGNRVLEFKRSNYGDKQISYISYLVKETNFYQSKLISDEHKERILEQIRAIENEIKRCDEDTNRNKKSIGELKEQVHTLKNEDESLKHRANQFHSQKNTFTKTKQLIETVGRTLKSLERESLKDVAPKIKDCQEGIVEIIARKTSCMREITEYMRSLQDLQDEIVAATVSYIEAFNSERSMNDVVEFFNEKERHLRAEYDDAKRNYASMKETPEYQSWLAAIRQYSNAEKQQLAALAEEYQAEENFNLAFVLQVIDRLHSEIAMVNEDESALEILRQTESELASLNNTIPQMRTNLQNLRSQMQTNRSLLEPFLDSTVKKISGNFSELFKNVGSAGAVQLEKPALYSEWEMNIMVKFRDNSSLKKLEFHTQSGGEKAVSTVLYMVALQEFTSAPFRIVDEINQGMDTTNERIVHKAIVQNACAENTSQYILITPKLLTDLYYHENVRIHCVMAGPWMPNPSAEPEKAQLGRTSAYLI